MSNVSFENRRRVLKKILSGEVESKNEVERIKRELSGELGLSKVPSNAEILKTANGDEREEVLHLLKRKPIRSISGVTVITVMPRPYPCPKKEPCIYCPGGPDGNTPQSYTGEEPASARAKEADYDPARQVKERKKQLRAIGHKVDKVELIVLGGTFIGQPKDYQKNFVHSCFDAISNSDTPNLKTAKKKSETASVRPIGVTFETRPDFSKQKHVNQMLKLGGTRVELGVQTVYNDIYELVNREHTVQDVIEATKIAKDSGLAVVYHMMPGLPGSSPERDLKAFDAIFDRTEFRPDMLKIYPCLVIKDTKLYDSWKSGNFDPLEGDEAVELVAKMKKRVPRWVRIQRIQRDIPSDLIEAGVWRGNFRDIVKEKLEEEGEKCECIRCREVGHRMMQSDMNPQAENAKLITQSYEASKGQEIFISFENPDCDVIFGHLRLRIPSEEAHKSEINKDSGIVRMLYVFGKLVSVGSESQQGAWQHLGFGRRMLEEAERIAMDKYDSKNMVILSGVGSRPYYRKWGYELKGPYMVKKLE